jgi:hypothetical protein
MTDDADRAIAKLAAVSDAELAADIRAAATDVLARVETWHRAPGWSRDYARQYETATRARVALANLPAGAPTTTVADAVLPVLNAWWPSTAGPAAELSAAIERLRTAAIHRPAQVAIARQLTR